MSVLILMELVEREDGTRALVQVDPSDHPDIEVMPVDPKEGPLVIEADVPMTLTVTYPEDHR